MKNSLGFLACLLVCVAASASTLSLRNDRFYKDLGGWNSPDYWAGTLSLVQDNGRNVMQLESATLNNRTFGRAYTNAKKIDFYPGIHLRLTVEAKGSGKFIASILRYSWGNGKPEYTPAEGKDLSDSYQKYTFDFHLDKGMDKVFPYLELLAEGRLLVRSFEMASIEDDSIALVQQGGLEVVRQGASYAPVHFTSSLKNHPFQVTIVKNPKNVVTSTVQSDAQGRISVDVPADLDLGLAEITVSTTDKGAKAYLIVQSPEEYDATAALAAKVKIAAPIRILWLSDSLSDFYRGYNYIDRLQFWFDKFNPGKVQIHNAGVGGDYTARMLQRLRHIEDSKLPKAHRQEMYNGLLDQKWDMVMLFLGQNDTRSWRKDNYTKPLTTPEAQEKELREIFAILNKHGSPKIVLMAPSPSNQKAYQERDQKCKEGQNMVWFSRPEFVDAYDAVNRKLCQELNLDYIDILTPLRAQQDIPSLYQPDAVHLSLKGGQVFTDLLLQYFAK